LEVIRANGLEGCEYSEPYAGGAGVAIELLVDGHVSKVHLNDSSYHIYAFWRSVLTHNEKFCSKISRSLLNMEEWIAHREVFRNPSLHSEFDVGFATFYLNRTNRSGVLTAGVIGGQDQSGNWKMDARFPRNELIQRIELIGQMAESIEIYNVDAETFFSKHLTSLSKDLLLYCDPPYFVKGSRLYANHYVEEDHARIAKVIQDLKKVKWIVSYDGVSEILSYYEDRRKFLYELQYNAARVYKGNEVFIFSDGLVIPRNSSLPYISKGLKQSAHNLFMSPSP
jgi:DNA adenine methylase